MTQPNHSPSHPPFVLAVPLRGQRHGWAVVRVLVVGGFVRYE
jgi:hypothetical protein